MNVYHWSTVNTLWRNSR